MVAGRGLLSPDITAFGAAGEIEKVKIPFDWQHVVGRQKRYRHAGIHAVRGVFQEVEAREASGVNGPDFALDGTSGYSRFDHGGVRSERVEFIARLRAANRDEELALQKAVVDETAFERAVDKDVVVFGAHDEPVAGWLRHSTNRAGSGNLGGVRFHVEDNCGGVVATGRGDGFFDEQLGQPFGGRGCTQ